MPEVENPAAPGPTHSRGYAVGWLAAAGYLAFAILVGAADVAFILRHHVTFPYGDQWVWLARMHEMGTLEGLYAQYNEHRLTVPGLFFLLDYRWFGARNGFLIIVSLLLQMGCAVLLIAPVWRQSAVLKPVRFIFCGFVIITMLWFIQGEDLFYPYQLQVACANFGVLMASNLLGRTAEGKSAAGLWAMAGFAFWATFSFGSGLLIWPVLLVLGLILRLPREWLWILSLLFLNVLVVYFGSYQTPPGSSSPIDSLRNPLRIAQYMTLLLGLPFFGPGAQDVRLATLGPYLLALSGIVAALGVLLCFAAKRTKRREPEHAIYSSILLFYLGAAFLAALGRSNFPVEQALSGRYAPMSLIFWISLAGLVTIWVSRREAQGGMVRLIWPALMVCASAMTFSTQFVMGRYMATRAQHQAEAAISITVGVPDAARVELEMAGLDMVSYVDQFSTPVLGHSFFARRETRFLGSPLLDHFQLARAGTCLGRVDFVNTLPEPSPPGVRLAGWAWEPGLREPPTRIWITDDQTTIRGFGISGEPRPDVASEYGNRAMESAGWVAYTQLPPLGRSFTVYAEVGEGKSVCQIGVPRSPSP